MLMNDHNLITHYIKSLIFNKYGFMSGNSTYDRDTHFLLRKYIRELKDKGLNLTPLVNVIDGLCINNRLISFGALGPNLVTSDNAQSSIKLLAIDIVPNTDYTFSIDAKGAPIFMGVIAYDGTNVISNGFLGNSYTSEIGATGKLFNYRFNASKDDAVINKYVERGYLKLVMQMPQKAKTLIGLEGKHSYIQIKEFKTDSYAQVAFSDDLIEYLFDYAVTPISEENKISFMQHIMNDPRFARMYGYTLSSKYEDGVYDKNTLEFVKKFQEDYVDNTFKLGYIDRKTEKLVLRSVRYE